MRKQIISILFLFILIAPVVSVFVLFQHRREMLREEVKEKILKGIDKEELVLLKFTEEQSQTLLNQERSKEFEYEGEMYDVVKMSVEEDTIHYLCWKDHEETRLKSKLADLTAKAMKQDTRNRSTFDSLNRLLSSLYYDNCIISVERDICFCLFVSLYLLNHYNSVNFAPPTPPPQKAYYHKMVSAFFSMSIAGL